MDDLYQGRWQTILAYRYPYDEIAFAGNGGAMVIGAVNGGDDPSATRASLPLVYTTIYEAEGKLGQVLMQTQLHRFTDQLQLREP